MSRSIRWAALAAWLAVVVIPAAGAAAPLDDHRWKDRLLIVFAASPESAELGRQRAITAGMGADMRQRDLLQVEVIGATVRGASESAAAMRKRYGVQAGTFRVLLIGKDGGVKLDSSEPISAQQLTGTIDAMPMRRQELGKRVD